MGLLDWQQINALPTMYLRLLIATIVMVTMAVATGISYHKGWFDQWLKPAEEEEENPEVRSSTEKAFTIIFECFHMLLIGTCVAGLGTAIHKKYHAAGTPTKLDNFATVGILTALFVMSVELSSMLIGLYYNSGAAQVQDTWTDIRDSESALN